MSLPITGPAMLSSKVTTTAEALVSGLDAEPRSRGRGATRNRLWRLQSCRGRAKRQRRLPLNRVTSVRASADTVHGGTSNTGTEGAWRPSPVGICVRMSNEDKISNKFDELAGKGKETAGKATDNPDLEAEGQGDQAKSNLKQAGEKVKDILK